MTNFTPAGAFGNTVYGSWRAGPNGTSGLWGAYSVPNPSASGTYAIVGGWAWNGTGRNFWGTAEVAANSSDLANHPLSQIYVTGVGS